MINLDNNETIKFAVDEIIPANGAKERMLTNIKRKAGTQNPKPISVRLSKWAALPAACLAVAVITAVGTKVIPMLSASQITSDPVKVGSSVRSVNSAEAFTDELGISVDAPIGSKNVQYRIIDDEIADISFVYNNIDYTLRASKQNGDFSGISGTAILSKLIGDDNNAMLTAVTDPSNEAYLKLEWNSEKTQYILSCADSEVGGNSPNIKNSDPGAYSHTEAANKIIDLYELIK